MGTRAAWGFLMANPNIFAGAILSSGATYATENGLADIVGIPIRNFYGSEDEDGLEAATQTTMTRYVSCGMRRQLERGTDVILDYRTRPSLPPRLADRSLLRQDVLRPLSFPEPTI